MMIYSIPCRKYFFRNISQRILALGMSTSSRCITVEPKSSLVTDRLKIVGHGFAPNEPITIRASVECLQEKFSFQSHAHIMTTSKGEFDLSTCESLGGSYAGINDMGLLWSMTPVGNSIGRLQVVDASLPKNYIFSVSAGHNEEGNGNKLCQTSIERCFMDKSVKRTQIKIGDFVGSLFTPPGQGPFGSIITIYGGNKHRRAVEDSAAILSNFGFISLSLQYYGTENTPKVYSHEPLKLEQFELVVDYLLSLDNCHSVGVCGASKGGEIGIAMMSHIPKVKSVACINGHISSIGTPTTYKGKSYPAISGDIEKAIFLPTGEVNIVDVLANPEDEPLTIHPFENSSSDLLCIVSLDDFNYKSELCADIAKKHMDAVGKTNYEIVKYPGMGHLVDAPFMPICSSEKHPLLPSKDMKMYYGGGGENKPLHASGQEDVWHRLVSFFKRTLIPECKL